MSDNNDHKHSFDAATPAEKDEARQELLTSAQYLADGVSNFIFNLKLRGGDVDQRFVALANTHFQEGFMCIERSIRQKGMM